LQAVLIVGGLLWWALPWPGLVAGLAFDEWFPGQTLTGWVLANVALTAGTAALVWGWLAAWWAAARAAVDYPSGEQAG
jgi:hypothetical protein